MLSGNQRIYLHPETNIAEKPAAEASQSVETLTIGPMKLEETLRKFQEKAKTGYWRETNTAGRAERSQWKGSRTTLRRSRETR